MKQPETKIQSISENTGKEKKVKKKKNRHEKYFLAEKLVYILINLE
jgi:hypothetical protein